MRKNYLPLFIHQIRTRLVLAASLITLLAAGSTARAQAPAWQNIAVANQSLGGYSQIRATATDASGNVYVAGVFSLTTTLGNISLTSSAGESDVFVAKWSPATNSFVWAQRIGGIGSDEVTALTVRDNSVYVVGNFGSPTLSIGNTTLVNADANAGSYDVFVAKFSDAGPLAWAQRAGGEGFDYSTSVAVNGTNVYVGGYFYGLTSVFGGTTLTNASTTRTTTDAFIAKLTDTGNAGNFNWAQQASGTGDEAVAGLATNGANVYAVGNFQSTSVGFGSTTLANAGVNDMFVAKLVDAGSSSSFAWAQRAGGTGAESAMAVAVNGTNVYMAGGFSSAMAGFGGVTLNNAGLSDIFVAKLTDAGSNGNFVWAQRAGGTNAEYAASVTTSGANVYLAGTFQSAPAAFGTISLANSGGRDIFVTKLTDAGLTSNFAWALAGGGAGSDIGQSVAVSGTNVYAAGYVATPASFGSSAIPTSAGYQVGVLAALTDAQALATTAPASTAGILMYPNPAHTTATVLLPSGHGGTQATLILNDALGRTVKACTAALPMAGSQYILDLTGLTPGVYTLQVQAGITRAVRQLIID